MPDYQPLHDEGHAITRQTSSAVTGGQLLVISGSGTVSPTTAATAAFLGVAGFDAPSGTQLTVHLGSIQRLVASGAITAGQNVEAATVGKVAAHTNGTNDFNIVGTALTTVGDGGLVEVAMRR